MGTLSGRTVWITGASSGIGAAVAAELARRGARVGISARSAGALEELAAVHPGMVVAPADITDPESVRAAVATVVERLGPIDVALLNAGAYGHVTPARFTAEAFRPQVEINIMGTVNCIEAVLPAMRERRCGRLAIVASVTGFLALPLASAYGATKSFLVGMSDSLRADLAGEGSGVEVTLIAPGFIRTPLTADNDFPMPFMIEADEAARTIVDGLERGDAEIAFPRRMAVATKTLGRILPGPVRRAYAARVARKLARRGSYRR